MSIMGFLARTAILATGITVGASAQTPAQKIDIVRVTGCLRQDRADDWMLINATDPTVDSARATNSDQAPSAPTSGKNQYRLIGVSEFNLLSRKDQTVLVKGLLIKATPMSRLNITSVTAVAASCTATEK
jgi:hypothetical protein